MQSAQCTDSRTSLGRWTGTNLVDHGAVPLATAPPIALALAGAFSLKASALSSWAGSPRLSPSRRPLP